MLSASAETGIKPIFNATDIKTEIGAQIAITAQFGSQASKAWGTYATEQQTTAATNAALAANAPGGLYEGKTAEQWNADVACWNEGGSCRGTGHVVIGGLTGGTGGAIGAGTASFGAPILNDIQTTITKGLQEAGINVNVAEGFGAMLSGTVAMGAGAATGGMAGAATAGNADFNNRMLRPKEREWLDKVGSMLGPKQRQALEDAACALTKCAYGVDPNNPNYHALVASQTRGSDNTPEMTYIRQTIINSGMFDYSRWDFAMDTSKSLFNMAKYPIVKAVVAPAIVVQVVGDKIKENIPTITITAGNGNNPNFDLPPDIDNGKPPSTGGGAVAVVTPVCVPPACVLVPAVGSTGNLPVNVTISSNGGSGNGGGSNNTNGQNNGGNGNTSATGGGSSGGSPANASVSGNGPRVTETTVPNASNAVIDPNKITGYALDSTHPVGGNKATVFESALGYNQTNAADLVAKIQDGVKTNAAILGRADKYGQRFTVDMPITGPNGNTVVVRTGWIIEPGSSTPRLTTVFVK